MSAAPIMDLSIARRAIAADLSRLEAGSDDADLLRQCDVGWSDGAGQILGVTGPPGAGKSTLTGVLAQFWRRKGRTVAVVAVDPSSRRSGGAVLGDRTRMAKDPNDQGLFIRSFAARDRLGGLAPAAAGAAAYLSGRFDRVILETVGVGQSETDVSAVADATLLCVQPGAGDALQFLKAGIMEIPDVAVVAKADMGAAAEHALADLRGALAAQARVEVHALAASARTGAGIEAVLQACDSAMALGRPGRGVRGAQILTAALHDAFGRVGASHVEILETGAPFSTAVRLGRDLQDAWSNVRMGIDRA